MHDWTYIPAPFLFTPRGLGLYFDTAAQSVFDFTQASRGQFAAQLKPPSVDCYFFIGDPKQMLGDYASLTGRVPLPPPWTFGVWFNSLQGSETVLQDAKRLRQQGVPATALWLSDLMDDQANLGFSLWTTGYYGQPGVFSTKLHELGYKVLGYVHPYVRAALLPFNTPSTAFQEGLDNHYFVLKADGQLSGIFFEPVPSGNIDFTKPTAVDWLEKMLRRVVVEFGFDGWMEDFGEQIEDDNRFVAGKSGREMANLYPLIYHKISYAIATKLKADIVAFSRSGYSGSQGFSRLVLGWRPVVRLEFGSGVPVRNFRRNNRGPLGIWCMGS